MWSQFVLCLLVGLAAASDYGWKSNTEYMYKVRGRTLTGLHEVANQYSGIILKADLLVRPQQDGKLMAKLSDAQYAQVHTVLPEGWRSEIAESKLQYKQLPLCEQPFEIIVKDGIVRDLIVSKEVQNWESNLYKSIVSQIQLDTQGQHAVKSHVNQLPEEGCNSAVFKTVEDTVTGKYETMYDIAPLPEYILQSQPWLAPMPQMKGDGEFIEIVKSKNFSRGEERVGYHYGLGHNKEWEPNTNQMGDFFLRTSVSRAVISGNLKRYTIQSSETTNKIVLSPTLNSEQKGMVVSHLNLTLSHVQPASGQFQQIQQAQHLGNLVYSYNHPFEANHEIRNKKQRQSSEDNDYSSEEAITRAHRYRRSAPASSEESSETSEGWTQELPKLHDAPATPLLPMYIGYNGKSIKSAESVNIARAVQKIAEQIGHEIQSAERIPKEKTLAKFTILLRLCRLMSLKEIQECAGQLYCKEQEGPKAAAWQVYRDAVAECGTGPALLTVQQWISEKKIRGEEAAEVVATMAQSARVPTTEYMRTFYKFATKDEVKQQAILNDTAILSFATLVRKVYVDKAFSHNEYPVHTFGHFHKSSEAEEFVSQEFIPYLKQKLHQAVEQADSHKVLVYTRALGNVAHKKILAAFETYLEGEHQTSQFQRLQMVLALDKLTQVHPKVARSVLYKIYQNAGEMQTIRVAAVFQLMRTCPSAGMLQRMAEYTNVDVDQQVNAAVKSAIESAAQLESPEFAECAENARSAEPLLTKETFGVHYSRNHLRDFVAQEMNTGYYQNIQSFGSEDSILPNGLKYRLAAALGGCKTEFVNFHAMVSSIDELTNVLDQQTEIFQQKQKQHKQNFQQAQQNEWSSEHIARKLNIETEEREQLEGNLYLQLGGGATRFFTFNNQTVEFLPHVIREIEQALREGQEVHYTKFINRNDMAISFPTEMSVPFFYTLDAPTVLRVDGEVSATAEPEISSGHAIQKPHTINAQAKIEALVSTKVQARLGFATPFDHQEYTCGYEKNIQFYVPIKSQIKVDLKNKQIHAEVQPMESGKNKEIFHFSTYPYTAIKDLLRMEPATQNAHVVRSVVDERATTFETVVGKQTGMAFRVKYESEQQVMDYQWMYEQLQRQDGISALFAPFCDETMMWTKVTVQYAGDLSTARKVNIRFGYENRYESEQSNESEPRADIGQFSQLPEESKPRQQKFAKLVASGINSADVYVCDCTVEFEGERKVEYTATAGVARSSVDEKSRALFYFKKSCSESDVKPYEIAFAAKARVPNTNGLDFVYALKFDPTTTVEAELAFGENQASAAKINFQAKLQKSEARREYLQGSPRAQECRREMQQGNIQLSACENMTAEANLMDRVQVKLHFENFNAAAANATYKLYDGLRFLSYFNFEENIKHSSGSQMPEHVQIQARFEPNFEYVNVSMSCEKFDTEINNIRVNSWAKQVVAVHPVFPVHTRVMSEALALDTYRPTCVADKNQANTFDNKTYPIALGHAWTVLMQYVPDFARTENHEQKYAKYQEEQQIEQYAVLVRDVKSGDAQKEIKMTIRTPESQGQLIEIDVTPSGHSSASGSQPCAKIQINKKEYQYNDKRSTDIQSGLVRFYALPNGEVKIEIRDAFYVIYNTHAVKITAMHQKLRDSVRGLCGTFSGAQYDDFTSPKNCILRDPREFAAVYAVEDNEQVQQYKSRAAKAPCHKDAIVYANVISDFDAGRRQQHYSQSGSSNAHKYQHSDSCTAHQTRYVTEDADNTVCFTVRPVPVCKGSCTASGSIKKNVAVHCVPKSNVVAQWMKQIQRGASPDFSNKQVTKNIKIEVPEYCSKY